MYTNTCTVVLTVRSTNYYDNSTKKFRMGDVNGMYKSEQQTVLLENLE